MGAVTRSIHLALLLLLAACKSSGAGESCTKTRDCEGDLVCVLRTCVDKNRDDRSSTRPHLPGDTTGRSVNAPDKWPPGSIVDVELTLVTTDYGNLACAMRSEVGGRYCAFREQDNAVEKPADPRESDKVLQPFTSVDRMQFMASGLWMHDDLRAKLDREDWARPSPRFSVKCKLHVQGKSKDAFIQWKAGERWHPANGWLVGHLEACTIRT